MDIDFSQGAQIQRNGNCIFKIWAPLCDTVFLHLVSPKEEMILMNKEQHGFFKACVEDVDMATRYFYNLDGMEEYPDPSSFFQPEGIHAASGLINHHAFSWRDEDWIGIPKSSLILYEIHVGTFTPQGTFEAIIPRLDDLLETGVNAIELMPVAQFPGERNWGYDGAFPFAVHNSYGGPDGLKKLVNSCHQKGLAVYLDVVYNHLGPEGNNFKKFGPYFTDSYKTPWGDAINFDGPLSDPVRDFFSDNVIYWCHHFHIDGLRLDAIHKIYDNNAITIWELIDKKLELLEQFTKRSYVLIAESDHNDPKVVWPVRLNGKGFEAQWLDDFHHALYVLLDKNGASMYEDFFSAGQVAKSITDGFVHSGEYVKARQKKHGASSIGLPGETFVAFNQNHDQVGNRVGGARLTTLISNKKIKLAAALLFLSPYIPLLFMGEEYSETAPFLYFIDHSDPALIEAVRKGRKSEFARFYKGKEPEDPQNIITFNKSKLQWHLRNTGAFGHMHEWYKRLIKIRKGSPALELNDKKFLNAYIQDEVLLVLHRWNEDKSSYLIAIFNLSGKNLAFRLPDFKSGWTIVLSTSDCNLENTINTGRTAIKISGFCVVLFSGL